MFITLWVLRPWCIDRIYIRNKLFNINNSNPQINNCTYRAAKAVVCDLALAAVPAGAAAAGGDGEAEGGERGVGGDERKGPLAAGAREAAVAGAREQAGGRLARAHAAEVADQGEAGRREQLAVGAEVAGQADARALVAEAVVAALGLGAAGDCCG